jgi:methionyl-tRNA formyltransferase
MSKNKLLPFFSSDDIALPLLTKLREKFELLVITKTDKPQGRSLKTAANDIAAFCEKNKINLWKIEKIDQEVINRLTNYDFDLGVCFAFGLFLPADLLNLFAGRLINIHPSALPQYRGASPLQASLLHDDKQTALSYILMTLKLDSGPLLGSFL